MALNERTFISTRPPVILSSTSINAFESTSELDGVVKNPSSQSAFLTVNSNDEGIESASEYIVPSGSHFILCTIPLSEQDSLSLESPIPGLSPDQSFNLIVFDPPWPNRSVRRSGHYHTHPYELLTQRIRDILHVHAYHQPNTPIDAATIDLSENTHQPSLAAIWTTNSEKSRQTAYEALTSTGFTIYEEWIWIKVTANGQPISPLNGIWRKPYEILVIGRRGTVTEIGACNESRKTGCRVDLPKRRVIAAVPDLHSRKPNLKAVFEKIFFTSSRVERYTALEVFARNLTAGWWAVGNEVLKFNARECWVEA
ncbi:hypothetical protein PENDEC_c037G03032 [Penicillium decumbens]|uniref:MT-A70-domain-containing protein n=1 Tax=Penicillium decumbens TaxID=69771 RepID=A0A1V6NRT9_PENDC|nr:hypothetical protein PENDEC_c037G03032 [Penicillium decumbens]